MLTNIKKYFLIIKSILPNDLKSRLLILYSAMLVSVVLEMFSLGSIPIFISLLVESDRVFNFFGFNLNVNIKNFFPAYEVYFILPILIIFIFLIKNIYLFFVIYLEQKIVKDTKLFFINSIFEIYLNKPYHFFLEKDSSEIIKNIFNESQTATSLISNILQFSREFSILIVVTILLLLFEPYVTIVAISLLLAVGFTFYKIFNLSIKRLGEVRLKFLGQILAKINILIGAIKDIKIYKKEKFMLENFKRHSKTYEDVIFKLNLIQKSPKIIFEFFSVLVIFLIFYFLIFNNRDVINVLPIIGLLAISIIRLMPAFSSMSSSIYYIKYVKNSFDNISNEIKQFKKLDLNEKKIFRNYSKLENDLIKIENLKFLYKNSKNIIQLDSLNLSIKKGEMIGIIGKSGTGKSTLINLMLGLLNPTAGLINIDRTKLYEKNIFSYVAQEIYLLDDNLRRNIAFGELDHEISDDKINEAIISAGLKSFVEKNEQGLDLIVGERGIRLSGGEKQRVGIARALYKKPEILILDEATSSLDELTEKEIIRSINKLKNKLTIIVVSHRLSTIQNCDKVFLISEGKIKGSGKLDELKTKYPNDFLN